MSSDGDARRDEVKPDGVDSPVEENEEPAAKAPWEVDLGVTAAAAALFLLLRLFAVADWRWQTAADVAESVDFSDAIPIGFGTLFARPELTGLLVAVLLPMHALNVFWPMKGRTRHLALSDILLMIALTVGAVTMVRSLSMWWVPLAAVAVLGTIVGIRVTWRKGIAQNSLALALRGVTTISVLGLLGMAAAVSTPWTSEERITTPTGVINGFVLSNDPGFLRVLTTDRRVIVIPDGDVLGRR